MKLIENKNRPRPSKPRTLQSFRARSTCRSVHGRRTDEKTKNPPKTGEQKTKKKKKYEPKNYLLAIVMYYYTASPREIRKRVSGGGDYRTTTMTTTSDYGERRYGQRVER